MMLDHDKINLVKEIVPQLREDAIALLLERCGGNVERAINAAIEFENRPYTSSRSSTPPPTSTLTTTTTTTTTTQSSSSTAIPPTNQRATARSLFIEDYDRKDSGSITEDGTQTPSSKSISNYRGTKTLLPPEFLPIPDHRRSQMVVTDNHIHFSIVYRRMNRSMGFSIQSVEGEIVVMSVDNQNFNKNLALISGVQVGDILVGINDDQCIMGTDTQDLLELFHRSGAVLTLHFHRQFNLSGRIDATSLHPAISFLLSQEMIKIDQVMNVDKLICQVRKQWQAWDDGAIAARIVSWQLDVVLQDYWDSLVSHEEGSKASSSSTPTSSAERRLSLSGRDRPSFVQRLSRRFSLSSPTNSDRALDISIDGGVYDESKRMHYMRPAIVVHFLRVEKPVSDKNCTWEDVECIFWCCDVRTELEWITKRKVKDIVELRRKVIKARHKLAASSFPTIPKGRNVNLATFENDYLLPIQKFIRELLSAHHLCPLHPSSIRVVLLVQEFLNLRQYMNKICALEEQAEHVHYRAVQVFIHQQLQLPFLRKVIDHFVDDFLSDKMRDVSVEWTEEASTKVFIQLKTFMDSFQSLLYSCFHKDCEDGISHLCSKGFELQGPAKEVLRTLSSLAFLEDLKQNSVCESLILQAGEEIDVIVSSAIRKQVELEVYPPCNGRIGFILYRCCASNEDELEARLLTLYSQPQSYYDIPLKHISPCSWLPIVHAFQSIQQYTLPCDKVLHLLNLSKAIPVLFRAEHPDSDSTLGADDLFPIFIYVVVQARLPRIWTLNQELQQFCDPDKAFSEAGYYLATLQACLAHLLEVDLTGEKPFAQITS